jgi:putative NIF3 family GTP cyclohydrolase 1 type 2
MARFSIGDIESLLFEAYPATDALPDDRFGLLVGNRATIVTRIAVALDQTVPMVDKAAAMGCNLLVAHHPGFFFKPECFLEAPSAASADGAVVYRAAQKGVALLVMHTNLDCALSAAGVLLEPANLVPTAPLKPHGTGSLGWIARPGSENDESGENAKRDALVQADGPAPDDPAPAQPAQPAAPAQREFIMLGELARAYQRGFGRVAKVWGDPAKPLFSIAVCTGGASEVVPDVIRAGVDCFVTGELRHHEALYLADENIALIELGHDVSELPYRFELKKALVMAGFVPGDIIILEPSATWWQPER